MHWQFDFGQSRSLPVVLQWLRYADRVEELCRTPSAPPAISFLQSRLALNRGEQLDRPASIVLQLGSVPRLSGVVPVALVPRPATGGCPDRQENFESTPGRRFWHLPHPPARGLV